MSPVKVSNHRRAAIRALEASPAADSDGPATQADYPCGPSRQTARGKRHDSPTDFPVIATRTAGPRTMISGPRTTDRVRVGRPGPSDLEGRAERIPDTSATRLTRGHLAPKRLEAAPVQMSTSRGDRHRLSYRRHYAIGSVDVRSARGNLSARLFANFAVADIAAARW